MTNKEKALALINTLATGDTKTAGELLAENYIQHNLAYGTGREAFVGSVTYLASAPVKTTVNNVRAFEEKDKVFLQTVYNFAGAGEQVAFDIFSKAGFASDRIFATQGDYGRIQCQRGCHPKTYDAEALFRKMDEKRKDCLIPSELVPKCPVCGGKMAMHLRCDYFFVEDEQWHEAVVPESFGKRAIGIGGDMARAITDIRGFIL